MMENLKMEKSCLRIDGEVAKRFLELIQNGHDGSAVTIRDSSYVRFFERQLGSKTTNKEAKKGDC